MLDTRFVHFSVSSPVRIDTGTIATSGTSGRASWSSSHVRSPPAHAAITTSFTVAPSAFLMSLTSVERRGPEREAAVGGDGGVERGAGRRAGGQGPDRLALGGPLAAEVEHRAERARAARRAPGWRPPPRPGCGWSARARGRCGWPARRLAPACAQVRRRPGQHLAVARAAARAASRPPAGSIVVALGIAVEHQDEQLGPGGAVDGGVVDLGEDGEAIVGQALDDVALPQRPAAVERTADDAGHQLADLLVAAGRRRPRCGGRGSRGRSPGRPPSTGGRG